MSLPETSQLVLIDLAYPLKSHTSLRRRFLKLGRTILALLALNEELVHAGRRSIPIAFGINISDTRDSSPCEDLE